MDDETVKAVKMLEAENRAMIRRDAALDPLRNKGVNREKGYRIGRAALMNAVRQEGRDVLSQAGDGYWRDMGKRYPWMAAGMDKGRRALKATSIFRDGKWYKRVAGGQWVEEKTVRRVW